MIRLPPTGISLSTSDLDYHLHQIDIYHGLLKQGFRKKDVMRFFEEQRKSELDARANNDDTGPCMPTTVQLMTSRLLSSTLR